MTTTFTDDLTFQVGDRVHYSLGTDARPGTVVHVTPTQVVVREDSATFHQPDGSFFAGGFLGHFDLTQQEATITEDPSGLLVTFNRKFPPKAIREYHGIPAGTRARYVAYGGPWRTGARLVHGWAARYDYNL